MARISQYKALGTSLGGYKSTLSKVQSMEYAKKHSDWKAGEEKSLYNEIGGTVSNILGIVKEKELSKRQEAKEQEFRDKYIRLDEPDRPVVEGPAMYSPEIIDVGDEFMPGPMENLDILDVQDIGEAPVEEEAFPSAFTSRGVHGAESDWKAKRQGMWKVLGQEGEIEDITTARNKQIGKEALKKRMDMKRNPSLKTFDSDDKVFNEVVKEQEPIFVGPPAPKPKGDTAYQGPVDAMSQELEMAGRGEAGLPKPKKPEVTDDFYGDMKNPNVDDVKVDDIVFDSVKYAEDYEALKTELDKPTPYKPGIMEAAGLKYLQKMPGFEGLRGSDFDQLFQEWMGTESAGRNVRQEINKGELGTGKGTGRAGGLWQMERGFDKDAEGELKGRGFQTSIQRFINMNKMFGEKVPAWVADAKEKDTPEDLTPQQQRELVFANMFMQEQSYGLSGSLDKQGKRITGINISSEDVGVDRRFDILRRSYQKGNYGELWARKHYAGAKPGSELYKEKIEQFERDKERAREYRYK